MRLKYFGEFIKEIERNPDYLINEIADKKRKRTPIVKTEGTGRKKPGGCAAGRS